MYKYVTEALSPQKLCKYVAIMVPAYEILKVAVIGGTILYKLNIQLYIVKSG